MRSAQSLLWTTTKKFRTGIVASIVEDEEEEEEEEVHELALAACLYGEVKPTIPVHARIKAFLSWRNQVYYDAPEVRALITYRRPLRGPYMAVVVGPPCSSALVGYRAIEGCATAVASYGDAVQSCVAELKIRVETVGRHNVVSVPSVQVHRCMCMSIHIEPRSALSSGRPQGGQCSG